MCSLLELRRARMLPAEGHFRQFVVNNPAPDEVFAIRNQPVSPHVLVVGGLRARRQDFTAPLRARARCKQARRHDALCRAALEHTVRSRSGQRDPSLVARAAGQILGLVPDSTLRAEYAKASVLLMTSIEETAPVAIGEACGRRSAIGTDGGIPDLILRRGNRIRSAIGDVGKACGTAHHRLEGSQSARSSCARARSSARSFLGCHRAKDGRRVSRNLAARSGSSRRSLPQFHRLAAGSSASDARTGAKSAVCSLRIFSFFCKRPTIPSGPHHVSRADRACTERFESSRSPASIRVAAARCDHRADRAEVAARRSFPHRAEEIGVQLRGIAGKVRLHEALRSSAKGRFLGRVFSKSSSYLQELDLFLARE